MARKPTPEQLFTELQDRYGKRIADAFLVAVEDLRSAADLQRLINALSAGNIETAMAALHLDPAAYGPLQDALQETYTAGGNAALQALPATNAAGAALVVRFNARNFAAETWLRDHSSDLVTRILSDQRTAVRSALVAGMQAGDNPRTTALSIVGRIDKATGTRQGGILGLSAPQEQFLANARVELSSADPAALRGYLGRALRDKRFDRTIAKAIKDGTTVPADIQRKAVASYSNRLLKLRGETIGRTEALTSLNTAQHEALAQAVSSGAINASDIRRTWRTAGDARVRDSHAAMAGETVGLEGVFTSPFGAKLRYPGDTSLGAPASEIISCRCVVSVRVDFLSNLQ